MTDAPAAPPSQEAADPLIAAALQRVSGGGRFTEQEAHELMRAIMDGRADTTRLAGLLMGLRVRGETVAEITGFARAMRDRCARIRPQANGRIVDTCGTGGARVKTFNVSTVAAFVTAGAGVTVAKHGNRSVTSPCGSADVLEALGADLTRTPEEVQRIIEKVGVGFLFAPAFHPAMKHAIPARKALGVRTVFNVLGPLTNPAGADAQVLGVFDPDLVEPLARVLLNLGITEAMVVHGDDGLDEVSTIGTTRIAHLKDGDITVRTVDPTHLGIPRVHAEDIQGLPPAAAAAEALRILDGAAGARTDLVALNAACAIVVGGRAEDIAEGLEVARRSLASGAARERLAAYVRATGGTLPGA